jgi:hypothetical protein
MYGFCLYMAKQCAITTHVSAINFFYFCFILSERNWKKAVIRRSEALNCLHGGTEGNHETSQSGQSVFWLTSEQNTRMTFHRVSQLAPYSGV